MKRVMLLAAFLVACAPSEQPATDSVATAGPAPLAAADVAGTWTGMSMLEGSDSVVSRWTVTGDGMQGKWVQEGSTDSVATTSMYDADSTIVTSVPYTDKNTAGNPTVTFRSVGRLTGGKLVGTAAVMLASKPDSVVGRFRWEATRAP